AFTGASRDRAGAFELAAGGTLFIDELGELPPELQGRLLRVLEQREVKRLGGNKLLRVRCRIVAATHRDLKAMVAAGSFREGLYFRVAQLIVRIPPLRERREDIPLLAARFLEECCKAGETKRFAPRALAGLDHAALTGNVRELKNIVHRAFTMC